MYTFVLWKGEASEELMFWLRLIMAPATPTDNALLPISPFHYCGADKPLVPKSLWLLNNWRSVGHAWMSLQQQLHLQPELHFDLCGQARVPQKWSTLHNYVVFCRHCDAVFLSIGYGIMMGINLVDNYCSQMLIQDIDGFRRIINCKKLHLCRLPRAANRKNAESYFPLYD